MEDKAVHEKSMKKNPTPKLALLFASLAAASATSGQSQVLFTTNFDTDQTSNWTVNNNGNGLNKANFFFDYSALGIPSAPRSVGGSTVGLKLGANVSGTGPASGVLPGISVSPTGQSFTGSYTLTFDWWHNWLGNASTGINAAAGGSGSTQLSTFGVLTSGTVANYAGASDSVFFGATGDGASSSDFRIYSSEKTSSYAVGDANATYAAGSRDSSATLYKTLFPGGLSAPAAQTAISSTQNGITLAGTAGFAWHNVEITKSDSIITWKIDGTLLATVDTTGFTVAPGGNNILFGMADTSLGAGSPASLFEQFDFTLIDNISVTAVPEPATAGLMAVGLGAVLLKGRRKQG
jgi:hypothetical protein